MALIFEWDPEKGRANLQKHGVSFEEASSIFGDPMSITIRDPEHSKGEVRYVDVGQSKSGNLLVVSYTERGRRIRVITARFATRRERRVYEEEGD